MRRLTLLVCALAAPCCTSVAPARAQAPAPVGSSDPGVALPILSTPDAPPVLRGVPPAPLGPEPSPAPFPSLVAALRRPEPAEAPRRTISDGRTFTGGTPTDLRLADASFARLPGLSAGTVRLPLVWQAVERRGPPAAPTDPADPRNDWAPFDRLVRQAAQEGLRVLPTVYGAPSWAEAKPRWAYAPSGSWAPDPSAFGAFVTAAATRYSGRFPDPARPGRALPRIASWQLWNEPNLPRYLTPQWVVRGGRWVPYAPGRYRRLLNAGHRALKAVDPTNVVVTAGMGPIGDARDGEGRMTPVRFWQALLCLGRPPTITAQPCPDPARFDAWALHPISIGDPESRSAGPLDVGIADLGRVRRLVSAARTRGRSTGPPGVRQALWVTELNWDSFPDSPRGVPASLLPRYVAEGLELLHRQGARVITYQFLRDPTPFGGSERLHPAGLLRIDPLRPFDPDGDRPKSSVRAWTMPFVARRRDRGHVAAWGLLPRPGPRAVLLERRGRAGFEPVARIPVRPSGLVRGTFRLAGRAVLRMREPVTGATSPTWTVGLRHDPLA